MAPAYIHSVRSYLPKSWFSDVSALVGPFCLAPPLTALSPPCVSHAQLARHEWLQLVVSSQWERDSHRGYISVGRHRAVSPPGLKVRGHGRAECRTVMTWGGEGVLGTTVLHSHWGTFHKTYLLLTPAFTVTFKVKNESNPFFSSCLFLSES